MVVQSSSWCVVYRSVQRCQPFKGGPKVGLDLLVEAAFLSV